MPPTFPAAAPKDSGRPLLLGSGSPRRRELLEQMRVPLIVRAPVVDERELPKEDALSYLRRIVACKIAAVTVFPEASAARGTLCADTCVVVDSEILGKPADDADAVHMLARLVGRSHQVLTRYALVASGGAKLERTVTTVVYMRQATTAELQRYVATGEGRDKAGSYAVQGLGAFLVTRVDGSYSNVVGLPVSEVITDLLELGLLAEFP